MKTLKHILVATDLSAPALPALDRGFQLAAASGARCTVLHALGLEAMALLRGVLGDKSPAVSARLVEEAQARLDALLQDPARHHGVVATGVIDPGLAGDAVPARAQAEGVDLVLVGAHGSGFLQRLLLGSTASRLLRKSRCPVLVVKQEPRGAYQRALVAMDFSSASLDSIRLARLVAPGADLLLLHVFEVPFEGKLHFAGVDELTVQQFRIEARERAVQQLHALAEQAGLAPTDYTGLVLHGEAVRELMQHEERHQCDLIVMGKHGTHVTEELLLGSVTKRVLAESQADVLVVVDHQPPAARIA
ncbi:MAG: universal stress protein [Hylemonella sp.]|nr:universal stress protein [Hylemonella sp.]